MSSLPSLIGMAREFEVAGQTYKVSPLRITDWAEVNERIVAGRADPVAVARRLCEGLPQEQQKEILLRAYGDATRHQHVTPSELDEYMGTAMGMVHCFWLGLRRNHPDITEDDAAGLFEEFTQERLSMLSETLAGMPEGNLPTPVKPGTTTIDPFRGRDGFMNSPFSMDGHTSKSANSPSRKSRPRSVKTTRRGKSKR